MPDTARDFDSFSLLERAAKLLAFDEDGDPDLTLSADDLRRLILANPVSALSSVSDYGSIGDTATSIADYGSIA